MEISHIKTYNTKNYVYKFYLHIRIIIIITIISRSIL